MVARSVRFSVLVAVLGWVTACGSSSGGGQLAQTSPSIGTEAGASPAPAGAGSGAPPVESAPGAPTTQPARASAAASTSQPATATTATTGASGRLGTCDPGCEPRERASSFAWNGMVLVVDGAGHSESYGATYADSNDNDAFDPADAGSFAPGSTIKVAIALAALEVNGGRQGIEDSVVRALVLSDNGAANTLLDVAGGPGAVTTMLQRKGITPFVIGRYLGSEEGDDGRCIEADRPGNCAGAAALITSLRGAVEPGWFAISEADRTWLLDVLGSTPRDRGFDEPDSYCRYVTRPGLQKCGVSPFAPQHFSNLAYFPDRGLYVLAVVRPPQGTPEDAAAAEIDSMTRQALDSFGT